jgi:hypothetical protein
MLTSSDCSGNEAFTGDPLAIAFLFAISGCSYLTGVVVKKLDKVLNGLIGL